MIGHFCVMSTCRGSGCCLATGWRNSLPGWTTSCVVSGEVGLSCMPNVGGLGIFLFFFIVTSPRIHHLVWRGSPYDPETQGQGYSISR